mmetsp:Transcript_18399/g.48859  ORF Transcript_18399/g.48859 Transcript_18399/m.48859 type:complete len:118 (-) Transcript_18399:92-445(-)
MLQLVGGMMQESQGDVEQVLSEARSAMLRSGRFGGSVECGPVFGQSYSSMSINGQKTAQVQLQFQVRLGSGQTSSASCSASIGPDGRVTLGSLQVDGAAVPTAGAGGGRGGVIDVDR